MGLNVTAKNYILDNLATVVVKAKLYDSTGAEILDHSDAAQAKDLSWGSASGGEITASSVEFQVKAGKTVAELAYLKSDLTEYGRDTIPEGERETYANDGIMTLTSAKINLNA